MLVIPRRAAKSPPPRGVHLRAMLHNLFQLMSPETLPTEHTEETNARILAVSEDRVKGFMRQPFQFIAEESGVP
ncbi:MAG TPA: hypothetical protein DIT13_08135, partial [Verrucomicrobiales bacterium]|nr:hypothetical protein [Verrucomicrobiales bacterium]